MPLEKPSQPSLLQVGVTTALVGWPRVVDAESYQVHLSPDGAIHNHTQDPLFHFNSLLPFNKYSVRVIAKRENQTSLPSDPLEFFTLPPVPRLQAREAARGPDYLDLEWQSSPLAIKYQLSAVDEDGKNSTHETAEPGFRIEILNFNQLYTITLSVIHTEGVSVPSEEFKAVTRPPTLLISTAPHVSVPATVVSYDIKKRVPFEVPSEWQAKMTASVRIGDVTALLPEVSYPSQVVRQRIVDIPEAYGGIMTALRPDGSANSSLPAAEVSLSPSDQMLVTRNRPDLIRNLRRPLYQ